MTSARCRPCQWTSALPPGSGETKRRHRANGVFTVVSAVVHVCVLVMLEHDLFILSRLHVSICMPPPPPHWLKQPGGGPIGGLGVRGCTGSSGGDRGRSHPAKEPISGGGRRGGGVSARDVKVSHRPMRTSVVVRVISGQLARLLCAAVTPPAWVLPPPPPTWVPPPHPPPGSCPPGPGPAPLRPDPAPPPG